MKRTCLLWAFVVSVIVCSASVASASSASRNDEESSAALFEISRFVIAGSVEDRVPAGIVNAFASSTEKVYCFLEARNIMEDTNVSFVWFHEDKLMATVTLPLEKGPRWRTWSSKQLGGLKGSWRVELRDTEGNVLRSREFTVE